MLTIASPNPDRSLLTINEMRAAIGLDGGDSSQDAVLTPLQLRVASVITKACLVVADGFVPPTLRQETAQETFRLRHHGIYSAGTRDLILSRRPIISVTSVTENNVVLASTDYEIAAGIGALRRLSGDHYTRWPSGKIVVVYAAGWATVPDDLKRVAAQLASSYYLASGEDQMEKQVSIPGVFEAQRWVDLSSDAEMPADLMAALCRGGYVNVWVG